MADLAIHLEYDGQQVRVGGTKEEPLFVAADVCRLLGLGNPTEACRPLNPDEVTLRRIEGMRGSPANCVTESGLYRLVMRSDKPEAKRFQDFVVRDVLPCIRQHGCYPAPSAIVPSGRAMVRQDYELHEKVDALGMKVEELGAGFLHYGKKLDDVHAHTTEIVQIVKRLPVHRVDPSEATKRTLLLVIRRCYVDLCPRCESTRLLDPDNHLPIEGVVEWDHWESLGMVGLDDIWPLCRDCNRYLGPAGGKRRADPSELGMFMSFHKRRRREIGDTVPKNSLKADVLEMSGQKRLLP
ncbi:MAG: hypothetical protein RJA59_1368 [Pseudomonadota bacterium]|jgi:prophage antirepressor-like protein